MLKRILSIFAALAAATGGQIAPVAVSAPTVIVAATAVAAAADIVTPTKAAAQELNADTNCTSPSSWTAGTGWTVSSGCNGSSVTAMKMLMQMNSAIKAGHRYKLTFTVSGYSAGQLRGFVGLSMPSAPTGSYVTAASTTDIADNFTTSAGLTTTDFTGHTYVPMTTTGPGDSAEVGGAMRFGCNSAGWGWVDPMVFPGLHNPHLHEFYGASNIGKSWTFNDFRTKAMSTCSNNLDPTHPVNRSGYWIPAMFDGAGHAKRSEAITVYYKGPSQPGVTHATVTGSISGTTLTVTSVSQGALYAGEYVTGAGVLSGTTISSYGTATGTTGTYNLLVNNAPTSQTVSSETLTIQSAWVGGGFGTESDIANDCANSFATGVVGGQCVNIPTGLRMTFGWKSSDNSCGAIDTTNDGDATHAGCGIRQHAAFDCWGGPNGEGGTTGQGYTTVYHDLNALMNAGVCVKGSWLHWGFDFPWCWDGTYVDTPNHRDHMNWGNNTGQCLADHPFRLPTISIQIFTMVDDAFIAKTWRLSCDEMIASYTPSQCLHGDYWEAWSPTVRNTWWNDCIKPHNSCTTEIGDGTGLKPGALNFDQTPIAQNGGGLARPDDTVPLTKFGMTPVITANGTYTYYLDCPDDMTWGFMGLGGFSGTITGIHIQDVGTTAKGPVTIHG